jgi:hypothetical protein
MQPSCRILSRSRLRISNRRSNPRTFASSPQPDINNTSHRWFQAGAVLIGLAVLEQGWHSYQEYATRQEFQSTLTHMQQEANAYSERQRDPHAAQLPTLFSCRVSQVEPSLNGTLMLQDVQVGDVVQVVTADVGPDQAYHLCRSSTSVGWYPREFLERVVCSP